MSEDAPLSLIILIIVFYIVGLFIAFYIRIRKIFLIRQIKKTGRVISISAALITMLMQHIQQQQRPPISPMGLPPPPPYTIQTPEVQPRIATTIEIDELPPQYVEHEIQTTSEIK